MRSARGSAFSSSAPRFDYSATNGFQMPAYTSHTSRTSPTKSRNLKQQPRARSPGNHGDMDEHAPPHPCSESDQNLLAMLTSTVACLKEKQMDVEALGCLEQSLWLKRRMFGIESPAVHKALHEVVLSYNSIAMQFLALGQFDQCLSMLRKAEAITSPPGNFKNCQSLQILTFNNIGCCYRKLGKLKSALKYLKEAAQIGAGCAHVKNLSITHLNLCAIQSQLGRHDLALEHAQAAIFHTQEELVSLDSGDAHDGEQSGEDVLDAKSREEKIVSLAVAYHNLAVELEFNGRGEASLQWYKKALQLVARFKDTNQALCESFEKIFTDAKKKYQGAQPASSQPTGARGASRARPKSAHPSSTRGESKGPVAGTTTAPRDVSYSATVASQCYKPTKPSTAGLQYTRTSPGKPAARNPTAPPPQRPSSATSVRRRPLSASSSSHSTRQSTANASRMMPTEQLVGESEGTEDTIERRWKQIEQELFGGREAAAADNSKSVVSTRPQSASRGRPQSARRVRQSHSPDHRGRSRGPMGMDQQFVEDDDECGIVQDECDDDDDDIEAQFHGARQPATSSSSVQRSLSARATVGGKYEEGTHRDRSRSPIAHTRSQRQPASARHRHVLNETRHSVPSRPTHRRTRQAVEDDSEGNTSSGYVGEEEDFTSSLSESSSSSDLPQQRVNHFEYLRRMKKLSDSIQEDLSSKPTKNIPRSQQERARKSEPPVQPRELNRDRATSGSNGPAPRSGRRPQDLDEEEPRLSTPRSASSKVRERLELVRRNSVNSLNASDSEIEQDEGGGQKAVLALPAAHNTAGIVIVETVHVFATVNDTLRAERELLQHASARRIQSAARGNVACRRFEKVRRLKEQEREAQMRAKRAAIEARELELQAQRVARLADKGNDVARVMQVAYRHELAREMHMDSRRVIIEAKELELQAKREARQTRRSEIAARLIQSAYRRYVHSYQSAGVGDRGNLRSEAMDDGDDQANDDDADAAEQPDSDEESHYTPLPSSRSSSSHRAAETSTHPTLPNTARSLEPNTTDSPLLTQRDAASPRVPSDRSSDFPSLTSTPRESVHGSSPRWSDTSPLTSSRRNPSVQNDAALRIQCTFRKHRASHLVATRHARRLSRSYVEHHHMSLVLTQAEANELAFLEELSAIKIQAVARGRQARFLVEAERIGRHAAATTIQSNFRRHQRLVERSTARGVESIAARNIQRKYRAYAGHRAHRRQVEMVEEAAEVHHIAAQTVQRRWRDWRQQRDHKVEEWEAATCIQALSRGHLARQSYQSLKASASRSSAFSIDQDAAAMNGASSRELIHDDPDDAAYEEAFDDDETEPQLSPVVGAGRATNLSFLPMGVRDLFVRYAAAPELLPVNLPKTSDKIVDEMLQAGYGLDEMAHELESCVDADGAATLLDAMIALVERHGDRFHTLPHIVRAATALETRIQHAESWDPHVETRAAAFVLLFQDLLIM